MRWFWNIFDWKGEPPAQQQMGPIHLVNFDDRTAHILTRFLDLYEGKQQKKIDELVARLNTSGVKLEDAVEANQPNP